MAGKIITALTAASGADLTSPVFPAMAAAGTEARKWTLAQIATAGSFAVLGANTFTALQTITQASANAGILASTGYSLTGSNATSMIDLAGTWNTSGTTTAFKLAVTNTASNAASKIIDLLGGAGGTTSLFNIQINGFATFGGSDQGSNSKGGFYTSNASTIGIGIGWSATGTLGVISGGTIGFCSSATDGRGSPDTALTREAAAIFGSTSSLRILNATAIPAGGTAGAGYKFSSTANFGVFFGSGAPSLSAAKGSLYLRSDGGGTGDRAYINTDGSGTWTALTTAA